jgi:iron complex outermembrane receptor protein
MHELRHIISVEYITASISLINQGCDNMPHVQADFLWVASTRFTNLMNHKNVRRVEMARSLMERKLLFALSCVLVSLMSTAYAVDERSGAEEVQLEEMVINASKPAVPVNLPATSEGLTATQIAETVNAVSSGEVLKYLPSIHVRERFSGDVNGGLAMRMYGVNSSADTLVYADGLILSSLLNNSCCPGPKWGMVSPEEIERVDAIYGPFSALYPGNSIGGVLLMTTHMPTKFEAHAKVDFLGENFKLYGTDNNYTGVHGAATLGNQVGKWSFWLTADRLDNKSHPTDFAPAKEFTGTAPTVGQFTDVTGAVSDLDKSNVARVNTAATSIDHTVKDNGKIKLAYDFSPTVRATYTLGVWQNTSDKNIDSYLRDAAGNTIYGTGGTGQYKYIRVGGVGGKYYTVATPGVSHQDTENYLHGLSVKSNTGGKLDWELAASLFDTTKDVTRTSKNNFGITPSTAATAGEITQADGTGWNNVDLRGEFRPSGNRASKHQISFGYHNDNYELKTDTYNLLAGNWLSSATGTLKTNSRGKTEMQAVYFQDAVQLVPAVKLVAGGRFESWKASGGSNYDSANVVPTPMDVHYADRTLDAFSPKLSLAYQASPEIALRGSYGRATRFPTVGELFKNFGISPTPTATDLSGFPAPYNSPTKTNDPNLKPESADSWELTAERFLENGVVRTSLFGEEKRNALISQTDTTTLPGFSISSVQNIDKVRSYGLETSAQTKDWLIRGLDLSGNVTYVNSKIVSNAKNPKLENTWQPLTPEWRAAMVCTYHASDKLSYTVGYRYSGRQHSGLFNTATMQYDDPNPNTYGGRSTFQVLDAKVLYKFAKQWSAAVGVNNIANEKYYTLYPYAQRNYLVGVKYDN